MPAVPLCGQPAKCRRGQLAVGELVVYIYIYICIVLYGVWSSQELNVVLKICHLNQKEVVIDLTKPIYIYIIPKSSIRFLFIYIFFGHT